jgi:hypothetical protein
MPESGIPIYNQQPITDASFSMAANQLLSEADL